MEFEGTIKYNFTQPYNRILKFIYFFILKSFKDTWYYSECLCKQCNTKYEFLYNGLNMYYIHINNIYKISDVIEKDQQGFYPLIDCNKGGKCSLKPVVKIDIIDWQKIKIYAETQINDYYLNLMVTQASMNIHVIYEQYACVNCFKSVNFLKINKIIYRIDNKMEKISEQEYEKLITGKKLIKIDITRIK